MAHSLYRRAKPLAWRDVGGRVVVIHSARGEVSELNDAASEIWRHLEHGATAEALAHKLTECFTVDHDTALEDALALLGALETLGLASSDRPSL